MSLDFFGFNIDIRQHSVDVAVFLNLHLFSPHWVSSAV